METRSTAKMAPVEKGAIPERTQLGESHEAYYEHLRSAVNKVRRYSGCLKVVWADFSVSHSTREKPVVYVRYEAAGEQQAKTRTKYFPIDELDLH
ncbi:hypothetical protein WKI13_12310 [Teredinibacter turnerae]|uniref:hypothetical protein n=1 Tax=Teredinibacter turnerae TaxID=2426 RepID=UPI0003A52A56|nr:hypothetical protein [Teredinibacter turnerae]